MFLFGHTGISVLVAYAAERIQARRSSKVASVLALEANATDSTLSTAGPSQLRANPRRGIGFDYRLVALGAMLPDIIDKPLALWIWPDVFETTRTIGHSALFAALLIMIAGLVLKMKHDRGPMVLARPSAARPHVGLCPCPVVACLWPGLG